MPDLEIKVKYHNTDIEKIEAITVGDWFDLRAAETVPLKAGGYYMIPLGVSMKLPEGYEAHIVPRSSSFKHWRIMQTNSVGIIDNSYCGDGDMWYMPVIAMESGRIIRKGERVCQFRIVEKMPTVKFAEVEFLTDQNRGGFGSTGKN